MLGRVCIIMIKMEEYYRDKNDVDFKHLKEPSTYVLAILATFFLTSQFLKCLLKAVSSCSIFGNHI